jgi:glycosyltransferase involved in cell wall biosynthesis
MLRRRQLSQKRRDLIFRVSIYHNILWSAYKAKVFACISDQIRSANLEIAVIQIAETEADRVGLGIFDLSDHRYPYELIFKGSYDNVSNFALYRTLFSHVWKSDSNLILLPGWGRFEYWLMLLAALIRRKSIGVFCDSTENDSKRIPSLELLKRLFVGFCDVYFVYGTRAKDYLKRLGAPESKIHERCQCAALPASYRIRDIPNRRRGAREARKDSLDFIFVGRLSKEKSLDFLLRAFQKIHKKFPDSKLRIIGLGILESELKQLATDLFPGKRCVQFLDPMDKAGLAEEYLSAKAMILPSITEPWGLVVNEALSYGCPVLVSDVCGCIPELVHEGQTGYSFISGNETSLIEAVCRLLEHFSDVDAVTENCLRIASAYTPDRAASEIIKGIESISNY